jgi:hypothetical protein
MSHQPLLNRQPGKHRIPLSTHDVRNPLKCRIRIGEYATNVAEELSESPLIRYSPLAWDSSVLQEAPVTSQR